MNKGYAMNRSDKIKMLQGIKDGKISLGALEDGRFYCFITYSDKPGFYYLDDKEFTKNEYQAFCNRINEANNGSIIWNEGRHRKSKVIEIRVLLNNQNNARGYNVKSCTKR